MKAANMSKDLKKVTPAKPNVSRRKFMSGAAAATTGAAIAGFPMIAVAQSPISLRWQSAWPSKDIFHEYALDYAKKVNGMSGGRLRIEVLPAGSMVKAPDVIDAVSKGALDGGHGVTANWYAKHAALALWGSGPAFGMDANLVLAWHYYGGGTALLEEIYKSLNLDIVSFLYGPLPTQPLGWFKKPVTRPEDVKGLKGVTSRATGLSVDIFAGMGAAVTALPASEIVPAMDRGLFDAAEFNIASSDRLPGSADAASVCMLQSYHQSGGQFEILWNKKKYDALPTDLRLILGYAVEAASADLSWKAIDRSAQDYIGLQTKHNVKFVKTPDPVLQAQLRAWDAVAAKHAAENPLFRKIYESQRAYAERAVRWQQDTMVGSRMAYNHFFAVRGAPAKKG